MFLMMVVAATRWALLRHLRMVAGGEEGGGGGAGRGREKPPKRKMKSPYQLEVLEKTYAMESYPSEALRAELSAKIGLSDRQLQMWFFHRRLKDRKVLPYKNKLKKHTDLLPPSLRIDSDLLHRTAIHDRLSTLHIAAANGHVEFDMISLAWNLVPELDKTSFWADTSDFQDIFDVDHFINSLRDEVRILKHLQRRLKRRVELGMVYSMPPVSWSDISYYHNQILPLIRKYKVVHLNRTDAWLANNGLPIEIQKMRCRVNYTALKFTSQIKELGKRVIKILRQNGPFLVLHLRYEMDMLAFSGCTQGCTDEEAEELTRMRYAYPWWKEKVINSDLKRKEGLCPLTPEETALVLRALDIDRSGRNIQRAEENGCTYCSLS
uniref:O-fucosyltransferase family protein n=1 Tax=Ananas comosus var. bracteatus TaxID=296719 RepID=A0A6V7P741_ANACO|nr:unnamed protein product [Ananas comosus var. bracteatus]